MKREYWILILIFLVIAGARLYFAFQTPALSADGYFEVRQVQNILATGAPLTDDKLSAGGRDTIVTPVFHYLLAFFSLFFSIDFASKIIPQILAASVSIIVFFIAYDMTKSNRTALFTSLISGFVPVFFSSTIYSVSPHTLSIPLMLFILYCFKKSDQKIFTHLFLISVILLPFVTPAAIVLVLGLLLYLLLSKVEGQKLKQSEIEMIVFSMVFVVWALVIVFKKAFLQYGARVIFQNIPLSILNQYFTSIQPIEYIAFIGLTPLVFGVLAAYKYLYNLKDSYVYMLIGLSLSSFILVYFKFITPILGLIFLGIILTVLSAKYFKDFSFYIEQTKVARFKQTAFGIIVALFVVTSIVTSISFTLTELKSLPTQKTLDAFEWIRYNTPEESTILGSIDDGHLITTLSQRSSVLDSIFLLTDMPQTRLEDIDTVFKSTSEVEIVATLNKYNARYVIVHDEHPSFTDRCFRDLFRSDVVVYNVTCEVQLQ